MKKIVLGLLSIAPATLFAQSTAREHFVSRTHSEFGAMLSSNTDMTSLAVNCIQYWGAGKKDKDFKFGLGVRLTAAFGSRNNLYITAPATLTSGKTGPGVFFSEQIHQNIDTFILSGPSQNFILNTYLSLGYDITPKWGAEFNIDLAGISAGPNIVGTLYFKEGKSTSPYAGDTSEQRSYASPTFGNVLLISDNDIGSLNSEFFVSYRVKPTTKIKAGLSFLFNEYRVHSPVSYINSVGTYVSTDRYRNKSLMFAIGASILIKKKKHVQKSKSAA